MPTRRAGVATGSSRAPTNDRCRIKLIGCDDLGHQPVVVESRDEARRLTLARLQQQPAVWSEPLSGAGDNPPLYIQPIRAAVQRDGWLVQAGLRRHQLHCFRRHIGGVGKQQVDTTHQRARQSVIEISLEHASETFNVRQVVTRASDCGGIDVAGVQLGLFQVSSEGNGQRCRPATQFEDPWLRRRERESLPQEELGPTTWHEDAGRDSDPQSGKLSPPQDLLQWHPLHSLQDQLLQMILCSRRGEQQLSLVLSVDTASGSKP
jgi:hypothetical protein